MRNCGYSGQVVSEFVSQLAEDVKRPPRRIPPKSLVHQDKYISLA